MVDMDAIAKQRLNVIMLVDNSTSMRGERIKQVNNAIRDIKEHLIDMQYENVNVDFYLTIITYSTDAKLLNDKRMTKVDDFEFKPIVAGGWSNLHLAYASLKDLLNKESKGGIMPDFGGVAPILLLLTDGHPTKWPLDKEMDELRKLPWFKIAIRYGIAIELNDKRTMDVLHDFVDLNGDVIDCYNSKLLERIIKIIILTASKVKSTTTAIRAKKDSIRSIYSDVSQQVHAALNEVNDWEW